jgi:CBS domain-containing protein
MKVTDFMTRHVEFIEPDATIQETVILMGELDVSALPLGSPADLKGIITDRDILYRVVAEGKDPKRTRVVEVATRLVFTCRPDDPLITAMDVMASHNIRRLPVAEEGAGIVGWLTLSDVSRRLLVESEVVQNGLRDLTDRFDTNAAALSPASGTGVPGSPPTHPKAEAGPPSNAGSGG